MGRCQVILAVGAVVLLTFAPEVQSKWVFSKTTKKFDLSCLINPITSTGNDTVKSHCHCPPLGLIRICDIFINVPDTTTTTTTMSPVTRMTQLPPLTQSTMSPVTRMTQLPPLTQSTMSPVTRELPPLTATPATQATPPPPPTSAPVTRATQPPRTAPTILP